MSIDSCPFCDIVQGHSTTKILFETDEIAIFRDRRPCGEEHLQVIPKRHIPNLEYLNIQDVSLVKLMYQQGQRVLKELCPSSQMIFGFHCPPMISVWHLHLHCLTIPLRHPGLSFKFDEKSGFWVNYQTVIQALEEGDAKKYRALVSLLYINSDDDS